MIYRVLEPKEYPRIPAEALGGYELSENQAVQVVAAVDADDSIKGIWCLSAVVHIEPIWVAPAYRHTPSVLRRLWKGVRRVLVENNLKCAVGIVPNAKTETQRIAKWVGAIEVPAKLYLFEVGPKDPHLLESISGR